LEKALLSLPQGLLNHGASEIKQVLDKFHDQSCLDRDKPFILENYLQQIDEIFGQDTLEDIVGKLQLDKSDWAQTQLQTMGKMVGIIQSNLS
jgi:hypothetical protein